MGALETKLMTQDEFLVWQFSQELNYELVDGLPVLPLKSVSGATRAHATVTVNVLANLSEQLRRKPFRAATTNIALKIPSGNVRRADAHVDCANADLKSNFASEPRFVLEVLSRSTMGTDRIRKVEEYKTIPSLAYILLVDTERPQLTFYVREGRDWAVRFVDALDAVLDLPEIGCALAARDVFEGLPFAE